MQRVKFDIRILIEYYDTANYRAMYCTNCMSPISLRGITPGQQNNLVFTKRQHYPSRPKIKRGTKRLYHVTGDRESLAVFDRGVYN